MCTDFLTSPIPPAHWRMPRSHGADQLYDKKETTASPGPQLLTIWGRCQCQAYLCKGNERAPFHPCGPGILGAGCRSRIRPLFRFPAVAIFDMELFSTASPEYIDEQPGTFACSGEGQDTSVPLREPENWRYLLDRQSKVLASAGGPREIRDPWQKALEEKLVLHVSVPLLPKRSLLEKLGQMKI